MNLNTILREHRKKFNKLKENTMNKRKENKLQNKMKKYFNSFDHPPLSEY